MSHISLSGVVYTVLNLVKPKMVECDVILPENALSHLQDLASTGALALLVLVVVVVMKMTKFRFEV